MAESIRSQSAVDRFVGARIRERRTMLGFTQHELALHVGVTYQQLHKYETAANRISASRLFQFAQALGAPIDYFFAGVYEDRTGGPQEAPRQRLALELSRNFNEITEPQHQQALAELARVLAQRDD
jgi:transcriptional regulator with XRE-family HTH domain